MAWFWGRKQQDEEEYSSYEEYTDSEGEEEEQHEGQEGAAAGGCPRPRHDDNDNHLQQGRQNPNFNDATDDAGGVKQQSTPHEEDHAGEGGVDDDDGHSRASSSSSSSSPSSPSSSSLSVAELVADAASSSLDGNDNNHKNDVRPTRNGDHRSNRPAAAAAADSGSSQFDSTDDDHTSSSDDEQIVKGVIPEAVEVSQQRDGDDRMLQQQHLRVRADSALSYGSGVEFDDEDRKSFRRIASSDDEGDDHNQPLDSSTNHSRESSKGDDDEDDEEEQHATSMAEKLSLLALAAEHDRVDILQAILNSNESTSSGGESGDAAAKNDREVLLNGGIPPLHIAVSYGSVNATNFLLRNGADPSIRPSISTLSASPDVPNQSRFDNVSAWELVFGTPSPINNMPPSKKEGIRHAFTAEALRCIGSDEVQRLQQLLQSGMPHTIDIGGKHLYDWSIDMDAIQCQALLRPTTTTTDPLASSSPNNVHEHNIHPKPQLEKSGSKVLDRGGGAETLNQLCNRLDELESLSKALSISLDGLAEEASVCNGLLLMGGGAAALASHVRSLKATKQSKLDELERLQVAWENSEDELAYWVKEGGSTAAHIASQMVLPNPTVHQSTFLNTSSLTPEETEVQKKQVKAQIAASEQKIRKLRVAITDLSEVCARDLAEVEKRGLSGGIHLVRGLRDEIRDIEYQLSESKSGDTACRTKLRLIQQHIHATTAATSSSSSPTRKPPTAIPSPNGSHVSGPAGKVADDSIRANGVAPQQTRESADAPTTTSRSDSARQPLESRGDDPPSSVARQVTEETRSSPKESVRIATGQSTAIAVRHGGGGQGFFPLSLWQILLRIIGFGDDGRSTLSSRQSNSSAHSQVILI